MSGWDWIGLDQSKYLFHIGWTAWVRLGASLLDWIVKSETILVIYPLDRWGSDKCLKHAVPHGQAALNPLHRWL